MLSPRCWLQRLWGEPGSGPGTPLLWAPRVALLAAAAFRRNHLNMHASGLAFYLLLSLVPFLALLLLLMRAFQVAERLRPYLFSLVAGGNPELVPRIEEYIRNAQSGMVGGLGTGFMFILGFVMLQRVKSTLNMIWDVSQPPSYRYRLIEYVAVLTVAPVLLAAAFGVTEILASPLVQSYLPLWVLAAAPYMPLANLTGYAIIGVVCLYAYRFLPDTRIGWWAALAGAVVGGVGLVLIQKFYVVLMIVVSRQSPIYGALAALPFLLLWFYVAWLTFLFGAQLSWVAQHYERELELRRAGTSVRAGRSYLAVLVLAALLGQYSATGRAVRWRALARQLRLPRDTVQETLKVLTVAELITPVQGTPSQIVPRERLEALSVLEVLERTHLLPAFPDSPLWPSDAAGHPLAGLFREANAHIAAPLAEVTLQQLADRMAEPGKAAGEEPRSSA
ncbi:MAG: YihY/virulence factor BrkB family protein [SAR324 cluster bacterium]|nr:YihY/virulence factor BrkB family protein [SAR324 cluster bacterium]